MSCSGLPAELITPKMKAISATTPSGRARWRNRRWRSVRGPRCARGDLTGPRGG